MWKLVALAGLIATEPQDIGSMQFGSYEECHFQANAFATEFIKKGWTYDRELSELAMGIVIDNGLHRIALWCEEEPGLPV